MLERGEHGRSGRPTCTFTPEQGRRYQPWFVDRLLAAQFPGAVEPRAHAETVQLQEQWPDDLSIDLDSDLSVPTAQVSSRIPVEIRWSHPQSGAPYEILLHVVDGRLATLELVDGRGVAEVAELPPADKIEISTP